jgi:hypothetical protein
MSSPAVMSPAYRKYVLRWDERPAAGTPEYAATQSRILQVFREWSTPEGGHRVAAHRGGLLVARSFAADG